MLRYQQETGRGSDIYTKGDIRGNTNKGGAALASRLWRCAQEKEALTWLRATQLPTVTLCGLLIISSARWWKEDKIVSDIEIYCRRGNTTAEGCELVYLCAFKR